MKVIKPMGAIKVRVKSNTKPPIKPSIPTHSVVVGEPYKGEYEVTPRAKDEVKLPTTNKTLTEDITIKKYHTMRLLISMESQYT